MLEDTITKINEAYKKRPTPSGEIADLLEELLVESGYSPYNRGDSKKITRLIKKTDLDIIRIEHRLNQFGVAWTYVSFSLWDKNKEWTMVRFGHCWG